MYGKENINTKTSPLSPFVNTEKDNESPLSPFVITEKDDNE